MRIFYAVTTQPRSRNERPIHLKMRSGERDHAGRDYLFDSALPTLFSHCTATCAIMRVAGVQIGKRDFLGGH